MNFIVESLTSSSNSNNLGGSIISGESGQLIALSEIYYHKNYSPELASLIENKINDLLNKIFVLTELTVDERSLFYGNTGYFYSLLYAQIHCYIDLGISDTLKDDMCVIVLEDYLESLKIYDYDLLEGSIGHLIFLLEFDDNISRKEFAVSSFIDIILKDVLVKDDFGYFNFSSWVRFKPEMDQNPFKINMGLAHGVPSFISIFSLIKKSFPNNSKVDFIINNLTQWFVQNVNYDSFTSKVPSYIFHPLSTVVDDKYKNSRLGWCYGDLSSFFSVYNSFLSNKHIPTKEFSFQLIENVFKRRNFENSVINDFGLCHGYFGVVYMIKKLQHFNLLSFDPQPFLDRILPEFDYTINSIGIYETPFPGKKETSYGFLSGLSGVGLAINSIQKSSFGRWDKIMLLNL